MHWLDYAKYEMDFEDYLEAKNGTILKKIKPADLFIHQKKGKPFLN